MKKDADVARSVTALAKNPQAPRHRYRIAYWMPAVAHTAAPRLSAFGRRLPSCPAAAAPLRWPANNRSPACGLQAATSSHPAPRQRLRHWLSRSCHRRPAGADFYSVRTFSRTARRLRHQLRSWLRRLRRGAVRRPALRGPPPLTCGKAVGCAGGACQPARSRPCDLLHCASIRRLRGKPSRVPPRFCSIPQVAHGQRKPAARDCQSKANPVCASRLLT